MNERIKEIRISCKRSSAFGRQYQDGVPKAVAKLQRIAALASTSALTMQYR
jgi:hypothetical protein